MYSLVDRPHDGLARGSHFLLWAMRCWILCRQQGRCPVRSMRNSFSKMGMGNVLPDFGALMHALDDGARHRMIFGDHGHPRITESEAIMLVLWACIAENEADRAQAILGLAVLETKVDEIMDHLNRIVSHMADLDLSPTRSFQPGFPAASGSDDA